MKNIKELVLIICLALLVRLPWLIMVPQVEAPDENTHAWVIKFISKDMHLPDKQTIMHGGAEAVYGSIPQFGYLPHILLFKLLPDNLIAQLGLTFMRLGSLLMGLILVVVAYFLGRVLFLPNHLAALSVPLMIIFHPQFVFVNSYANNDSTASALASIILLLLIPAFKKGLNIKLVIAFVILFAWLSLSKYSGYCTLLTASLFLPIIVWLHREKLKQQAIYALLILLLSGLIVSPWFIHNYFEFNGDLTGIKTMYITWAGAYHRSLDASQSPISVIVSSKFWRMLFFSFWGWFGYMTRPLPRVIYYSYLAFVLVAIYKTLRRLPNLLSNLFGHLQVEPGGNIVWVRSWIWILFTCSFLINLAACALGCTSGVAGPQGRYLFPSEIPIISMLLAGLVANKQNKQAEVWLYSLLIFNFLAYSYATIFLYQIYCH